MNQLGVFAKYWQTGSVMTRLAASIGDVAAADLYCGFVKATIRMVNRCPCDVRRLAFTPSDQAGPFAAALAAADPPAITTADASWQLWPQPEGSLGRRMAQFFSDAFQNGATKVVLIGSDSPSLPVGRLEDAFDRLDAADVVLGPSDDGGYYLIGMRQFLPDLFQGIDWSTDQVFKQTVDVIQRIGLDFESLAPWYDVDRLDDLRRLQSDLSRSDETDASELIDRIASALRRAT